MTNEEKIQIERNSDNTLMYCNQIKSLEAENKKMKEQLDKAECAIRYAAYTYERPTVIKQVLREYLSKRMRDE